MHFSFDCSKGSILLTALIYVVKRGWWPKCCVLKEYLFFTKYNYFWHKSIYLKKARHWQEYAFIKQAVLLSVKYSYYIFYSHLVYLVRLHKYEHIAVWEISVYKIPVVLFSRKGLRKWSSNRKNLAEVISRKCITLWKQVTRSSRISTDSFSFGHKIKQLFFPLYK